MVWGMLHQNRDYRKAMANVKTPETRLALFHSLLIEVEGDTSQTMELCNAMNSVLESERYADLSKGGPSKSYDIDPVKFKEFESTVNSVFLVAIKDCYGKFVAITKPLVTQSQMSSLCSDFKRLLPIPYETICMMLNYQDGRRLLKRYEHMNEFYDRMVFHLFVSIERIKNRQTFVWISLVRAAVSFGEKGYSSSKSESVFFGHSSTNCTFRRYVRPFSGSTLVIKQAMLSLEAEPRVYGHYVHWAAIDNAQKGQQRKFQRDGFSSNFLVVTAAIFVRIWANPPSTKYKELKALQIYPKITYINQAVPAPITMEAYEAIPDIQLASFVTAKGLAANSRSPDCACENLKADGTTVAAPDATGARVAAYTAMIWQTRAMNIFFKNLSLPDKHFSYMRNGPCTQFEFEMKLSLKKCRGLGNLFNASNKFHFEATASWRGMHPIVEMLPLPVSSFNEMTNEGIFAVVLHVAMVGGLLSYSKETAEFDCPANVQQRNLILVGDGLTNTRLSRLKEIVKTKIRSFSYRKYYKAMKKINAALNQIIIIPGDLHGGCFHFMKPVYDVYYGNFLQPVQCGLGWTRVNGADVVKTYHIGRDMAVLVNTEIERQLSHYFLNQISNETRELLISFINAEDHDGLASFLAKEYISWKKTRLSETTDEVFRAILQFNEMTALFSCFYDSIRNGDAVMIEVLYLEFLPLWVATGKKHCTRLVLDQVECLYKQCPPWLLQTIRENRCQPLYEGTDRNGKAMANWSDDGILEKLMPQQHDMAYAMNAESWREASANMPLVARSKVFVENEYHRRNDVEAFNEMFVEGASVGLKANVGNKKDKSVIPKDEREHMFVAEFLMRAQCCEEMDERLLTLKYFWETLEECEMVVTSDENHGEKRKTGKGGKSDESPLFDDLSLLDMANDAANASFDPLPNILTDEPELEQIARDLMTEMETGDEGSSDLQRIDLLLDEEESEQATTYETDREEEIHTKGGARLGKVRKVKMSEKMKVNLRVDGVKKMEKMEIQKLRGRAAARQEREQKTLHDALFDYLQTQEGETTTPNDRINLVRKDERLLPVPAYRSLIKTRYKE
jgi:hypothetical protein